MRVARSDRVRVVGRVAASPRPALYPTMGCIPWLMPSCGITTNVCMRTQTAYAARAARRRRLGRRVVDQHDQQGGAEAGQERRRADADQGCAPSATWGRRSARPMRYGRRFWTKKNHMLMAAETAWPPTVPRAAPRTPRSEPEDQQRVEGDLDGDRDDPEHGGEPHPALGAHQAGEPGRDDRAGQDDHGVVAGVAEGLAAGAEQRQQRLEPGQPDHGDRDGGGPEHGEGVPGRAGGGARVARAEVPGDHRGAADADGGRDRAERPAAPGRRG